MYETFESAKFHQTKNTVTIHGQEVGYIITPEEQQAADTLKVTVEDPNNAEQVQQAISEAVKKKHWFLMDEFQTQEEKLTQRLRISLSEGVTVDIFNFQEEKLSSAQVVELAQTLALLYQSLKDKSLWKLDSIQIRKENKVNGKNGEPFRGLEVPEQKRFELFPASLDEGLYRGKVPTSWLKGATLHEATHVILENVLQRLWFEHKAELGWRDEDEVLIELPGGIVKTSYNEQPSRCPTEYATYQEDDDRAESVVMFLTARDQLDELRRKVVGDILSEEQSETIVPIVDELQPEMPRLPTLAVVVSTIMQGGFIFKGTFRKGIAKPKIPIAEFRKQKGITA